MCHKETGGSTASVSGDERTHRQLRAVNVVHTRNFNDLMRKNTTCVELHSLKTGLKQSGVVTDDATMEKRTYK